MPPVRIIVTGEHENLEARYPTQLDGRALLWLQVPVLRFERLPVARETMDRLVKSPAGWIIFTSPRAVRFFGETLLEAGLDFPLETQVATIGESTAEVANADGFTVDFYPTEPGTEKFLEEFAHLVSNNPDKPEVLLPQAEGGRPTLREKLAELGCKVTHFPLYVSRARDDIPQRLSPADLDAASLVLFTSPSSVDAFLAHFPLPAPHKIVSIGRYTAEHLKARGVASPKLLPEGDFGRIGEVLS
jgi:uroporphyrinogen-III synthase